MPREWFVITLLALEEPQEFLRPMMKPSQGNIFRVMALFAGNSLVTGEFPSQMPVTRSFDVFFLSAPEQTVEQTILAPMKLDVALSMASL